MGERKERNRWESVRGREGRCTVFGDKLEENNDEKADKRGIRGREATWKMKEKLKESDKETAEIEEEKALAINLRKTMME